MMALKTFISCARVDSGMRKMLTFSKLRAVGNKQHTFEQDEEKLHQADGLKDVLWTRPRLPVCFSSDGLYVKKICLTNQPEVLHEDKFVLFLPVCLCCSLIYE